jgi:TolA-binding protein
LKQDPDFTSRDAVYFYLGEALVTGKKNAEALPYYEKLVEEFQKSEYLADATKRIAELKGPAAQS